MVDGSESITDRLRSLTREGGSLEAAQISLIGLDDVRAAAGPRWPRMRRRVRQVSMDILSKLVDADDFIIPAGDGFLVIFANPRLGVTQKRCMEMREALVAFYLGDEALASLRAEVRAQSFTTDGLTDLLAASLQPARTSAHHGEIALAPLLVAREGRIGATLVAPIKLSGERRRITYNPDFILDGRHHSDSDFLGLDLDVLDVAVTHLRDLRESGRMGPVGVTTHASTMRSRRTRDAYLAQLAAIDSDLRDALFVQIAEIERGAPLICIADWCSALRQRVSRVWLDFHYADHAIGSVGGSGATAAGFHLPSYAGAQRGGRAERMSLQITFWARSLHGQGMRLIVHDYQNAQFMEQARAQGVDMLTSDRHWPFSLPRQCEAAAPNAAALEHAAAL